MTSAALKIRVLVADDHPIWLAAVAKDLAESGCEVVATATDGAQAVDRALLTRPDVVVTDLQMPQLDGAEATRQIVAGCPSTRVLILSASGQDQDVLAAVKAGATGYLVKSASITELVDAVVRTKAGDPVFTPGLAGLVLGEFRRLATRAVPMIPGETDLTAREAQILRMVATGLSYRQIADRLVLSHRTVQNHVQKTLGKLQLHSRAELQEYAISRGLDGAD